MAFNDELLPHVLFGDVTKQAADLARRSDSEPEAREHLRQLLDDLKRALAEATDDEYEVANLVWASFVANAHGVPGDDEEPLRERLRSFQHLA